MTVAAFDRIVHHATIIECNTESYRTPDRNQKPRFRNRLRQNLIVAQPAIKIVLARESLIGIKETIPKWAQPSTKADYDRIRLHPLVRRSRRW
jgi:hypothetical protein